MALVFAHTTAGYLGYELVRPPGPHRPGLLLAAVALANGADLDFLPGLVIGQPGVYHRGMTHTLGAVLVVGAAVALAAGLAGRGRAIVVRATAWAAALYASHLVLDYFTADAVAPYGGRFLWPLSGAYYIAPVPMLEEVIVDGSARVAFVASLLTRQALGVWGRELACLVASVALVHGLRREAPAGEVRAAS